VLAGLGIIGRNVKSRDGSSEAAALSDLRH
jgi:hypothetical protein